MPATPILVPTRNIEPAPFGLLETFPPQALPGHGGLAGVEYDSEFCGTADAWVAPCVDPGVATKEEHDGIEQVTGIPIPIYHLFTCRLIGISSSEATQRASRALDLGASRAVEEAFGQSIGAAAVDVTPGGTATGVVEALALLEQAGGSQYGGRRVIHADLAVTTLLISQRLVQVVGGHLETLLGSIVIAGPGYGGLQVPSAPAAGAHWMYATGAVNVWQGETIDTPILPVTPYDNEFKTIAERIYVPTYECFAAAAEVLLEA